MLFSKKWLQNHPQFLLHFLIHIGVLMLCRKFELIPRSNYEVTSILDVGPRSYYDCRIGSKSPQLAYNVSITILRHYIDTGITLKP